MIVRQSSKHDSVPLSQIACMISQFLSSKVSLVFCKLTTLYVELLARLLIAPLSTTLEAFYLSHKP